MSLDEQIRAELNGYDIDAAGQIEHLTGAIRAVLEQHRPNRHDGLCDICNLAAQDAQLDKREVTPAQPCPTVQVIARELGITEEADHG